MHVFRVMVHRFQNVVPELGHHVELLEHGNCVAETARVVDADLVAINSVFSRRFVSPFYWRIEALDHWQ